MSHITNWLAMGGYAAYVWPTYGLVCAVLLLNLWSGKRQRQQARRQLQRWYQSEEGGR